MFAPTHTLILISRQVAARIDLTGHKRLSVKRVWTQSGSEGESLVSEVARAIQLGSRRPGRITILSPDFFTQVIELPSDLASIANQQEIVQALALEAEVESGLSAFESQTAAFQLETSESDESLWCVTQVSNAPLRELTELVRSKSAKFNGIAHPLAARLSAATPATREQSIASIRDWRDLTDFDSDGVSELAIEWAASLQLRPRHPMLLLGGGETTAAVQPAFLSASLALAAACGCVFWHWHLHNRLTATTQSIERMEKISSQQDANDSSLKAAEATLVTLRQQADKAQSSRQSTERQLELASVTYAQHNRRWTALIEALAQSASADCWVQKLDSSASTATVQGLALSNAAANNFAGRLETALRDSGWKATPAATHFSKNELVVFRIVLRVQPTSAASEQSSSISSSLLIPTLQIASTTERSGSFAP